MFTVRAPNSHIGHLHLRIDPHLPPLPDTMITSTTSTTTTIGHDGHRHRYNQLHLNIRPSSTPPTRSSPTLPTFPYMSPFQAFNTQFRTESSQFTPACTTLVYLRRGTGKSHSINRKTNSWRTSVRFGDADRSIHPTTHIQSIAEEERRSNPEITAREG